MMARTPRRNIFASAQALTLVLAIALVAPSTADFTVSFDKIASGDTVPMSWARADPILFPLYVEARVYNRTDDGGVVMFEANLTTHITGNAYTWSSVPYPLPYIPGAEYQVEVKAQPQNDNGTSPIIASSKLFQILSTPPGGSTGTLPTSPFDANPDTGTSSSKPSTRSTVLAICLGLGIPILVSIAVWLWCRRRRQKRNVEEERRKRRFETVIY